jgi:hypothetical protein
MIHASKTVTVTADDHSFQLDIDGETIGTVPRTISREIHRYKAYATHKPGGGRTTGPGRAEKG